MIDHVPHILFGQNFSWSKIQKKSEWKFRKFLFFMKLNVNVCVIFAGAATRDGPCNRILFLHGLEVILADATEWAGEIIGEVLEGRSGFNAIIGIAYCRVIDPATYFAYILFHLVRFCLRVRQYCYIVSKDNAFL